MNLSGREGRTVFLASGSWLTILFTLWILLMLWASVGLSNASAWIPRLVLSATLVCLLLQLAQDFRAARARLPLVQTEVTDIRRGRTMAAIAWLVLLLLLTRLLGIAPASTLFCLAWLRWHAGEGWRTSLVMSAGLGLALWILFSVLLGVGLYSGALSR